jgi:hypothetical protein
MMPGEKSFVRVLLPWLAVGLLVLLAIQPLAGQLPQGHDTLLHFYRIPLITAQWRQGVLFSRWSPDLMLGYGYPLLNFYPPLSVYGLALAAQITGGSAPTAMSLAFGLTVLLAAAGMFLAARDMFGTIGGLFASAAYTLSPTLLYHVLQRGSISNALAMALFPLSALAMVRAVRTRTWRWVALASLALAAVLLAHVAASLSFVGPLAGLALAVNLPQVKQRPRRHVLALALALTGGLALAAFFWLPALAEARFTQYAASIASPDVHFSHFFADILHWPEPAYDGMSNPPLPVGVGCGQLILAGAASALALMRLASRRGTRQDWHTGAAGLLGFGVVLLASPISTPLWEHLTVLRYVQFPWRLLDPGAFLLSIACGGLVGRLKWQRQTALVIGASMVFFANAMPYCYPPRWQSLSVHPTLDDVSQAQVTWGIYGLTSWGEYAPSGARLRPVVASFAGADNGASLAQKLREDSLPPNSVKSASGTPWRADMRLGLAAATTIVFDTFHFPGWSASIDGAAATLGVDDDGRMTLTVPAGEHAVSIAFGETPVRVVADIVSAMTALVVVVALASPRGIRKLAAASDSAFHPIPALGLAGLAVTLLVLKVAWLDRVDTPLVRHIQDGTLAGVRVPESRNFGDELWLVGYRLDGPDRLTLYWESQRVPSSDYAVELVLTDPRGAPAGTITNRAPGLSITSRWQAGQLVRDAYTLPLTGAPKPSGYYITVGVLDAETGGDLRLLDAPDETIVASALGTVKVPPVAAGLTGDAIARFGGAIELEGAQVPVQARVGTPVTITLNWRSLTAVTTDYTVFIHLLDADGELADTGDGPPCAGLYPTSFWSPGERIVDDHQWQANVAPGEYQVLCGLYQGSTGERLPASGSGVNQDQALALGKLTVTP